MGAKGKRRREKNYLAAHGGPARLPPPPKTSQLEALPSKLRTIMSFTSSAEDDTKKKSADETQKKSGQKYEGKPLPHDPKNGASNASRDQNGGEEIGQMNISIEKKKNKRKRKRKEVIDFRFETKLGGCSKRREKKKKYFEAKKQKRKKGNTDEDNELHKKEKIEFGDVVEAPPKLVSVPKPFKTAQHASKERIRLQAIDAYRERKGWSLRPGGIQLPPSALS